MDSSRLRGGFAKEIQCLRPYLHSSRTYSLDCWLKLKWEGFYLEWKLLEQVPVSPTLCTLMILLFTIRLPPRRHMRSFLFSKIIAMVHDKKLIGTNHLSILAETWTKLIGGIFAGGWTLGSVTTIPYIWGIPSANIISMRHTVEWLIG